MTFNQILTYYRYQIARPSFAAIKFGFGSGVVAQFELYSGPLVTALIHRYEIAHRPSFATIKFSFASGAVAQFELVKQTQPGQYREKKSMLCKTEGLYLKIKMTARF